MYRMNVTGQSSSSIKITTTNQNSSREKEDFASNTLPMFVPLTLAPIWAKTRIPAKY